MSQDKEKTLEYKTEVLIIGGGPAGIQATRSLKAMAPETRITVLRPEPHSMVYCALPYAIEGLFPLSKTFKSDDLLLEVGAELIQAKAASIDFESHEVRLDDGRRIGYDKLLIASGASPLRPRLPGANLANVYTVKTAADAQAIMARLGGVADCEADSQQPAQQDLTAVVVGSGAIGIEQATAYRSRGARVHLVEMRDHVLPHLIDADMAEVLHEELRSLGVELHLEAGLKALHGTREVETVELVDGKRLELSPGRDMVVMAVGMRPDLGFLEPGQLKQTADGIEVDERMRSSAAGVWAAGDCCAGWSGIDGRALSGKLATNAVPMAKIAARDILGQKARYPGFVNGAATVVGRWRVAATGFTESYSAQRGLRVRSSRAQTTTRFPMMPEAGQVTVKLVFEEAAGRIVGGQIVGSEAVAERIDVISLAIQQKMRVHELADLSYSAQPWQTFFPARNAIVEAATLARTALA